MALISLLRAAAGTLLALAALAAAPAEAAKRVSYQGHSVLRVNVSDLSVSQTAALAGVRTTVRPSVDVWAAGDFRVGPSNRDALEQYLTAHHLPYDVMIEDLGAQINRERSHTARVRAAAALNDDFFADYRSLADIDNYTAALAQKYPSLVSGQVIGKSHEGRPLHAYTISGKKRPGDASKQAIYLEFGIHAREWITHATGAYIFNALVTGYGKNAHITSLLDTVEYIIVPVVNTDGYAYTWSTDRMWRKTTTANAGSSCIGTDPNRNWDNHWCLDGGSTDPCDESYCGPSAFSEPCVVAVASFVKKTDNIVAAVDFHSYSQMWMTPYGYSADLPANNKDQDAMSKAAVKALTAVYGTQYVEGPIYTTVYPASGSSADYFYDNTTHVKYSFGVELRDTGAYGFVLPADQIKLSGNETLAAVLAMGDFIVQKQATEQQHQQKPNIALE